MDSAPDSLDCSEKSNDGQNSPPKRKQSESISGDQGAATLAANPTIVSTTTTGKSPSISSVPPVSQQTRHARRIYVGGIPVGHADEEILKSFLNAVISKGLNEENDHSYVLSVYINQKKCFTFVEFKSIELTTACLELDGLIYYSSVLKVLRANEYKPELLPPSHNPPIKLYLPASAFGTPVIGTPQCCCDSPGGSNDLRLDYTFIQNRVVSTVERDSIVLIGFPHDDTVRRATGRAGSSVSPKAIRNIIKKHGAGTLHNPEYNADMTQLSIFDIGDISPALPFDEAHSRLVSTVAEVVRRGAIPFVLGGSSELCAGVAAGLMSAVGGVMGVVNINSQLDVRDQLHSDGRPVRSYRQLLEDPRFCPARGPSGSSCDGRLVIFGAQGTQCSLDQANYITGKGGRIVWLSKDLRRLPHSFQSSPSSSDIYSTGSPQLSFQRVLGVLGGGSGNVPRRPIYVSINAGVMLSNSCPGSAVASSVGLTSDEILDLTIQAGTDPNVAAVDISEIIPELEETRSAKLCVDILYRFCLGVAIRQAATSGLSDLKLGPNVAQFLGSAVPGGTHQSFPPLSPSSGVPIHSNLSQSAGGSSGFITNAESERMQAVYHAQQQNLRLHQQQLKQRAVTHPSLLGQFADPVTGHTFSRITALHSSRSGRQDSQELPGPNLQRAFEYDTLAQDYQYRESMRALDATGQRQSIPQDRKYGQYQSQNQGPSYQGHMAFGQQGQGGAQTASTSVHDPGGKGPHGHQPQGGVDAFMSPYGFGRSGSGSGTHSGMQPGHPPQVHGQGQGGQGQGLVQPRLQQSQQQRQQLQHSLQQQQQQQQQQAKFAASRGLGGAVLNNPGINRARGREGLSRPIQQGQEMLTSHHGLSGILDFDYDEAHSSGYLGRAISPSRSSRTSSSASVNNDYASDYGSFVSSSSRGYEKVDVMSGHENEDYMVGTVSRRPSYTMHSSPRPSELSIIQQQQQEGDFEGFEGHLQALRISSPLRQEQQPFLGPLSGGGGGMGAATGAGSGSGGGASDSHFTGRPTASAQNLDTSTPR